MLGPLFHKELLEVARRPRYYVARTLVGLALLVGLWLSLRPLANMTFSSAGGSRCVDVRVGRGWARLVRRLGVVSGARAVCVVPAGRVGVDCGEKDGRTLEVLLTTCLEDREILIGKLASRLLLLLVMILSSFPAVAIAGLFGGFDLQAVVTATIVHGTVAVFVACLGLYYSTVTRKPYVAAIRTYFVLAVIWYLIPRGLIMLLGGLLPGSVLILFSAIDPLRALVYAQQLDMTRLAPGFRVQLRSGPGDARVHQSTVAASSPVAVVRDVPAVGGMAVPAQPAPVAPRSGIDLRPDPAPPGARRLRCMAGLRPDSSRRARIGSG